MTTLVDVQLLDISPENERENPQIDALLQAANDALSRALSADSVAFVEQSRQQEGE